MNCPQIETHFSALYEGTLADELESLVTGHLESCGSCRQGFDSFVTTVGALRAERLPATSEASASAIMRAIDLASYDATGGSRKSSFNRDQLFRDAMTSPLRRLSWRKIAGHVASASVGAAAVILVWVVSSPPPTDLTPSKKEVTRRSTIPLALGTPSQPIPPSPIGAELRFVSGSARIARGGQSESVDGSVMIYPGEVVEISVPPVQVIERRAPWLPVDFEEIDIERAQKTIDRSMEVVLASYATLRDRFDEAGHRLLTSSLRDATVREQAMNWQIDDVGSPSPDPHAELETIPPAPTKVAALPPVPAATPTRPSPAGSSSRSVTQMTLIPPIQRVLTANDRDQTSVAPRPPHQAPVELRRIGDRLTLSTRGRLSEVVPSLIAHLNDADADVVDLVEERLTLIRETWARHPGLARRFAASDAALLASREDRRSFIDQLFGAADVPSTPLSAEALWTHWWESNRTHLLQSGSEDVF